MRAALLSIFAALALTGSAFAEGEAAPAPQTEAAAPAVDAGPAAEDGDGKVVCKRIVQTGSRLNSERICMTIREWKLQTEDARSTAREVETRSGPGGMNPNGATTGASR
jgi:hypothetical protein